MKRIILNIRCPFCGNITPVIVFQADYDRYANGALAQDCFPYLSATGRETIISGICPYCQDDIFGDEDDSDDEDYEPSDIDDDCGFDPYEGCYTYDC